MSVFEELTPELREKMAAMDEGSQRAESKPTIHIENGKLHLTASDAEDALILAEAPVFVRGGELVKPIIADVEAAKGARTKTAGLAPITADFLVDWLSRAAEWLKFNSRANGWRAVDPPQAVAKTILSREGEWRFRRLAGVITTPTMRPDGTVLSEEGYDPATGLLLMQPPEMPPVPQQPTRQDAKDALKQLDPLLNDFPFVDPASRSVALSALITPIVRGALSVAPLHVMRAPTPGSGKSYLVDISSAIATGQRCPVISSGKSEEEMEKRLSAALLAGQSIISIDNLNGELTGDLLCQAIERPVVQIRPLGCSKLVSIESRATVFATGNNLTVVGDMVRRVLLCSLDSAMERPELRQFGGDPLQDVIADRGKYIAAALTVVRAYVAAGYPNPCPALASFEDWSLLVRSALVWLGCADPVDTMEAARAEDPETATLSCLASAWSATIGLNVALTAGEVIARAEERDWEASGEDGATTGASKLRYPVLHEAVAAIAADRQKNNPTKLGRWLGLRKGRIINGSKFESQIDPHSKINRWMLVSQTQSQPLAGVAGGCGYQNSLTWETVNGDKIYIVAENTPATTAPPAKLIAPDLFTADAQETLGWSARL